MPKRANLDMTISHLGSQTS